MAKKARKMTVFNLRFERIQRENPDLAAVMQDEYSRERDRMIDARRLRWAAWEKERRAFYGK